MQTEVKDQPKYAIVAAVQLPEVSDIEFESSLAELRDLAKTLGYKVVHTFTQRRPSFDRTAYLGEGKREEIRVYVQGQRDATELAEPDPMHSTSKPCWWITKSRHRRHATWKKKSVVK